MTKIAVTVLVALHLIITLWHGDAHSKLAIELSPLQTIFVYAVILFAPILAAGLVWTRYLSMGIWLFAISMLGALLFGAYHHYVLVSPDNIGHLPSGSPEFHSQFTSSAAAVALLELASTIYGAYCLGWHHAQLRTES